MQSGKLRYRVILERRVDVEQTSGQIRHDYLQVAEVWASITPVTGREFIAAQQVQSDVTSKIVIRFRSGVDQTWRVRHVTKRDESPPWYDVYDIRAVLPDGKTGRRELVLMCSKNEAEGWRG